MGGKVLEHEAKDILRKGALEIVVRLVKKGKLSVYEAAKELCISEETLMKYL